MSAREVDSLYVDIAQDGEYVHDGSKSDRDGKFIGMMCDQVNQADESERRVKAWIEQLKGEGFFDNEGSGAAPVEATAAAGAGTKAPMSSKVGVFFGTEGGATGDVTCQASVQRVHAEALQLHFESYPGPSGNVISGGEIGLSEYVEMKAVKAEQRESRREAERRARARPKSPGLGSKIPILSNLS